MPSLSLGLASAGAQAPLPAADSAGDFDIGFAGRAEASDGSAARLGHAVAA